MTHPEPTERITGRDVLEAHLDALVTHDARLAPIRVAAGEVPLRLRPPGFATLAYIVTGQLLSVKAAAVIHQRLADKLGDVTPDRFLAHSQDEMCGLGLTQAKYRAMRAAAEAELDGGLDYLALAELPANAAMVALTRFPGIGPWTAEIYLLSAIGHADIFPAGDLALRKAVGYALDMETPDAAKTRELAAHWSPWRAAAARLLWRYYALRTQKEGIGL